MSRATPNPSPSTEELLQAWADNPERAVIFDFNGTLSDDEPILADIFAEIFADRLGWVMTHAHYREHLLGHSDREIVQLAVAEHGDGDPALVDDLLALRRLRYKKAVESHSPITTSVTALLRRLSAASTPLAIVTGAQREDVMAVLDNCEAGAFIDHIVAEEDVERGKPDPEGFLKGAELLGRAPSDILVFEDSVPGVLGAARAGMQCIAITGATESPELRHVAPAMVPRLADELFASVQL
jgi:HAD superfamily hydrolase (TIGR01509 family)